MTDSDPLILRVSNIMSFRIGGPEESPCPWCGGITFDAEIHRCRDWLTGPGRRSRDNPNPEGTPSP